MTTLHLNLKAEYFDAIAAGTKVFEFRLATPYWRKRLEGRTFDAIELAKGYPARDDATRRLRRPWRGFEVQTITHPHFGNDPVEVFAIRVQDRPLNGRCAANNDGDCDHRDCPQLRDGEPVKSGRHCPFDQQQEEF
jgi:hypothetical protein